MIKIFTLNKNNKIELTKEQLEHLLNEAYWEGNKYYNTWIYSTPNTPSSYPYTITTTNELANSATIKGAFINNEV